MSATAAGSIDAVVRRPPPGGFTPHAVSAAGPYGGLSARERRVLRLLAEGYRTSEIAIELAYSERTIKHSITSLTSRMKVRNRTQAVAFAVREGLI
jgi:DNA-binding NarL/FixJ family response regulator